MSRGPCGARSPALWRAALSAGLLAALASACSKPAPLATLQEKTGTVERDWAAQPRVWKAAELGTKFHLGDGLQTHANAAARLSLDDGSLLSLDAETQVRFSDVPPTKHSLGFDVEMGAASLQASGEPLSIQTRVGLARIEPGATVVFSRANEGLRVIVEVGRAVFGSSEPLAAGSGVSVLPDGALAPLPPAEPPPAEPPATEPEPAAQQQAEVLARVSGRGARLRTERGWSALAEGSARLQPGSTLELARRTSVELQRGEERAQLFGSGRYVVAPRSDVLVEAAEGSLSAGSPVIVRIAVPGGIIAVAPSGSVNVQLGKSGATLDVQAREATVDSGGEPQRIRSGQRATLTAAGELSIQGRGLEYADVEIIAGESLILHDPSPPTAVRFRFEDVCPEGGVLSLRGGKAGHYAVGDGAVALALGRGAQRYELRCAGDRAKVVRQGKLTVLADDGTRRVAARAPVTTLAADGHRYTVLYQNRLPVLTLTWPNAPQLSSLSLTHEFEGKQHELTLTEPRHTFESGTLREGRHAFVFAGGGKVSRHTRVDIQFDNAAPTATLEAPAAGEIEPGEALTISGIALPGWQVKVGGEGIPQDPQGRFSASTTWPSATRALAVRLSHPERGTHVYLRRAGSGQRVGRVTP